jgi:hypothetical protein
MVSTGIHPDRERHLESCRWRSFVEQVVFSVCVQGSVLHDLALLHANVEGKCAGCDSDPSTGFLPDFPCRTKRMIFNAVKPERYERL